MSQTFKLKSQIAGAPTGLPPFVFVRAENNEPYAARSRFAIQQIPNHFSGTGHGNVATVLVVQQTGSEYGCVAYNDITGTPACCGGVVEGGDEKLGASQTQTRTIAESGATQASEFVIILDANEPAGDPITLEQLAVVSIALPERFSIRQALRRRSN